MGDSCKALRNCRKEKNKCHIEKENTKMQQTVRDYRTGMANLYESVCPNSG